MALILKLSKTQRILLVILFVDLWILLGVSLVYGNPQEARVPTADQMYESNPFSVIAGNWSSSQPDILNNGDIPVTYEMVNMLGKDYPCANEQLTLFNKDNHVIPIQVNYVNSKTMNIGYPSNIPEGAYVVHTHPLNTCGDFTKREVATFPSPADLLTSRKNGIDDVIVMTKVANDTAIAARVYGFKEAPPSVLEQYGFLTGIVGYNEMTTLYTFETANITSEFYTIHINSLNGMIVVNKVDADAF